jgi:ferredoxin
LEKLKGESVEISFEGSGHKDLQLESGASLSLTLNASNSPVLFGCRIGICGTCTVEVEAAPGFALPQMEFIEEETLSMYAPGNARARLACQLKATCPMRLKKIEGL